MMALGVEVGFGPGHIALDGDPATLPKKGAEPPKFRPVSVVAKRLDASRKMEIQLSRCIATVNKFILMNANRLYPHDLTFRRTEQSSESYAMTSAKRGLCVMIGNKNFSPQSGFMRRAGSDVDMATLYVVFKQLGFDVAMHRDVTAAETFRILTEGLRLVRKITHMLPV